MPAAHGPSQEKTGTIEFSFRSIMQAFRLPPPPPSKGITIGFQDRWPGVEVV